MPILSTKLVLRRAGILLVFVSTLYLFSSSLAGASSGGLKAVGEILLASPSPTPPPEYSLHLPNVIRHGLGLRIELRDAWMADGNGNPDQVFMLDERVKYVAQIFNDSSAPTRVGLRWVLSGHCGEFTVFDEALTVGPGEQTLRIDGSIPNCQGLYSVTVQMTHLESKLTDSITMVAVDNHQGFDKCAVPTISQMQTWWIESPYWAVNMYIGGISRACDQVNLTPDWITKVAQQGWTYIPTWVGPQAPCTNYKHRMSSNKFTARQQGREEAEMAVAAAARLGLLEDLVIYYDLEGYFGDTSCRTTVSFFVEGWVERLHELGYQAGVYGGACSSSIADWAENEPAPDNVWIAHWLSPSQYRPKATVWDVPVNIPCLTDDLWPNHQRIKQYAGGHTETFGGLSFSIDSNTLDGDVTVLNKLNLLPTIQAAGEAESNPLSATDSQEQVRHMQPLNDQAGWVLSGERLWMTGDSGASWRDITPQETSPAHLLAVTFTSPRLGWVVRQSSTEVDQVALDVLATQDGGQAWLLSSLILGDTAKSLPVASAHLNFVDHQTGFLSLKLQSSSAFSLGRLFATQDGGRTWEERSLPIGDAVAFVDGRRGWVAGGPGGNELYRTLDGGRTWQAQSLPLSFSATPGQFFVGLPEFHNAVEGSLPVTLTGLDARLLVFTTQDGGETWNLSEQVELTKEPGISLAFSADSNGGWWAATPGANRLWAAPGRQADPIPLASAGLPEGVIALDFVNERVGWALAQAGICRGEKISPDRETSTGVEPLSCASQSFLLVTRDGGQTWQDVTP